MLRGLENFVAAIIVLSIMVSLAAAATILVSRAVYSGIHVISSKALMAVPPTMELKPLSSSCNNGLLQVELRIPYTYREIFSVVLYDLSGQVVGVYNGSNGSALIKIPCDKGVVITLNTSSGAFWVYRYELDPRMRCLEGYIVNASTLIQGCTQDSRSYASEYPLVLQPIWIRSTLVDNDALELLDKYGPVPGIIINVSEMSYTIIDRDIAYSYLFAPARIVASATLYSTNSSIHISYPTFCKPGVGCLYKKGFTNSEDETNVLMHLEYEYAVLLAERPGWIHLRDYRAILPLRIKLAGDEYYEGWGRNYTWIIEANLSPPFFSARIRENITNLYNGYTSSYCTKKSISSLYTNSVNILLIPLLVSRNSSPILMSFGVLPVQYTAQGKLSWVFRSGSSYTIKEYGPYNSRPQYVAIYAYLVPLSEWRIGIPVDLQALQLTRSSQAVRAVYRTTLLNLTMITASRTLGGLISINVSDIFNKSRLLDDNAILAVELLILSQGSSLIVDTTNNTDDIGYSHFCNVGVAFINGVDDYIHLSVLPSRAYSSEGSWILLAPGEGIAGYKYLAYNVTEIEMPRTNAQSIEFREQQSTGEYIEEFNAQTIAVECKGCKALQASSSIVEIVGNSNLEAISAIDLRLRNCVSAETILERFANMGRDALIIK